LFTACFFGTFINPYGAQLWREVWNQLSDSSLRFAISEWFPTIFYPTFLSLWLCIGVVGTVTISVWKKVSRVYLVLFIFFILLGASSIRHMPFTLFIGMPLGAQGLYMLWKRASTFAFGKKRFSLAYYCFGVFSIMIAFGQLLLLHDNFLIENEFYPKQEVAYLKTHLPTGNLFSIYDWGGYLIWKLPEKKVFIDGRMPSWRWQGPKNESNNAFKEGQDISSGKEKLSFFENKYHISAFLLSVKMMETPEGKKFIKQLEDLGYQDVFSGKTGIIYEKL
jgi:hypothetical protein